MMRKNKRIHCQNANLSRKSRNHNLKLPFIKIFVKILHFFSISATVCIVFCDFCRLYWGKFKKKETQELEFTRMILENKSTIYTVCYMFSKDKDEIDDLFQEVLWN